MQAIPQLFRAAPAKSRRSAFARREDIGQECGQDEIERDRDDRRDRNGRRPAQSRRDSDGKGAVLLAGSNDHGIGTRPAHPEHTCGCAAQ